MPQLRPFACLVLLLGIASVEARAAATWQISSSSKISLIGSSRFLAAQTIDVGNAPPPAKWRTHESIVFPEIGVAFGEGFEIEQAGQGAGNYVAASGSMTLALPITLMDTSGGNVTFNAGLTTGTSVGVSAEDGTQSRTGSPRAANGAVTFVAVVEIPPGSGTVVDGRLLFFELIGSIPFVHSDGDGIEDLLDNCPLVNNSSQTDADADGLGNACDSLPDSDGDGVHDGADGCPQDASKIAPGQCGCGVADTDTDGDGTANCNDQCPNDPAKTAPGACGCGVADTNTDGDGAPNCTDGCPLDANKLAPGVCGCGVSDVDTDADGTANCNDQCPNDPAKTAPGACGCGVADTNTDGDAAPNCTDGCPLDANKLAPGVCGCGVSDVDTDADGTANCNDQCPNDPAKTAPGACGCGVADTNTDGDAAPNCTDGCPLDASKLAPGVCGCGVSDVDTDADGTANCNDQCPNDPAKTAPGACGCGVADTNTDGDAAPNCTDGCPLDASKLAPGVCGCGVSDADTDADGTANCNDQCPNDPAKTAPGACGCGVSDVDADADGTVDCNDQCPNDPAKLAPGTCGCGVADTDTDGDAHPDCTDDCPLDADKLAPGACGCGTADTDTDGDGTADCNDDCPSDPAKLAPGTCGCGTADTDADGDGTADCNDQCPTDPAKVVPGACGCGTVDTDADGDGTANCNDQCPADAAKVAPGLCGCGTADTDTDTDGDGTPNCTDGCPMDPLETDPSACDCGSVEDTDGDGHVDCADNCPSEDNADQGDWDGDGGGDACDPLRVSFQPQSSPTPSGFVADHGAKFDPALRSGWSAAVPTRDRLTSLPTELDTFVFSGASRSWQYEVPNGDWELEVVSGDAQFAQGPHRVRSRGTTLIDDVTTAAGQFATGERIVEVRNGRLEVEIGGTSGTTLLNLVEARYLGPGDVVASINFQPAASVRPAGYLADSGLVYDGARGYGWDVELFTRERGSKNPQVLDTFAFTSLPATWQLDLPDGWYHVQLTVGDPSWAQGPHRVEVEGTLVLAGQTTAAGQFRELVTLVEIADGSLSVVIGGGGGNTVLDQIVVTAAGFDLDGDGLANDEDNCPSLANPEQSDVDGDGAGDACESDDDGDGVADGTDNCASVPNADQADADGDAVGDLCDLCPDDPGGPVEGGGQGCDLCGLDPSNDVDDDGWCAADDNCPELANTTQADWDGDGEGDACDVLRVDFKPAASAAPAGYEVDHGERFEPTLGWGWLATLQTRERLSPLPIELDTFVFSGPERVWQHEVPNGDWRLKVVCGDSVYAQGPHRVTANRVFPLIDNISTAAGQFAVNEHVIEVRNGRIELAIGGNSGLTMVNVAEARLVGAGSLVASVNFQPASSPAPSGYLVDGGDVYDPARGYGWNVPVATRERGARYPQVLDTFAFSQTPVLWEMDLPPGTYRVQLALGDPLWGQGAHRLEVEGALVVAEQWTFPGEFLEVEVLAEVTDGRLSVRIGGGGGNTMLNQLVISTPSE